MQKMKQSVSRKDHQWFTPDDSTCFLGETVCFT